MSNIVIQIELDKQIIYAVTLENASITKQTIEAAVLQATGLTYDQYEVYYRDSEDDLIMTVVEEDYSIAEMTLEADTIAFHIDVKVPADQIRLPNKKQEIPQAEEKIYQGQESSISSEDISQEQKVQQVYKSDNSQVEQKDNTLEQAQLKTQNLNNPNVGKNEQLRNENKQQAQNPVIEFVGERQNNQQIKNQIENSKSEDIQCDFEGLNQNQEQEKEDYQRLAPQNPVAKQEIKQEQLINCLKYLEQFQTQEALFNKFLQKLTTILKPECFKTHPNTTISTDLIKKEDICLLCNQKITKTPYYINRKNQMICQTCETTYEETQSLVKIRNQASKTDILATKLLSLSYNQLSKQDLLYFVKETDPHNRSKKIEQLFLLKMRSQKVE